MMTPGWKNLIKGDSLSWLLEYDLNQPGPRFFALSDLLELPGDDSDVFAAQQAVMRYGPVPTILASQHQEGFWGMPGPGYLPKYTGTIWQIIFLSQLGADGLDPHIQKGCEYVLKNCLSPYGGFSLNAMNSGMVHCLEGNLTAAMIDFGFLGDKRLVNALDWLARSISGDGIAPAEEKEKNIHYYRSGNSGPNFSCSANDHSPCAWGAVKAAMALGMVTVDQRTAEIAHAIDITVNFLLSRDPVKADYPFPYSDKPSRSWFQFGYPIGYVTDVLQNLEILVILGCASNPLVQASMDFILSKQDSNGRWPMEYSYNGKTLADIEEKGKPSKWVTLRALRVIKKLHEAT